MTDERLRRTRLPLRPFRALIEAVMSRWLDLAHQEKIVLTGLVNHSNNALLCWPSRALIAKECGMSESAFYRWRNSLDDSGWIHVLQREHRSSIVSLLPLVERLSQADAEIPEHVRAVLIALVKKASRFPEMGIGDGLPDSQQRESATAADSQQREQPIPTSERQKDEFLLRKNSSLSKGGAFSAGAKNAREPEPADGKILTLDGQPYEPASEAEAVEEIFSYWAAAMRKPRARLDDKRRNLIAKRLKNGYSPQDLMTAIAGCVADPWSMGENERGKPFNELSLILRDAEHIERYMELAKRPSRSRSSADQRVARNVDAARRFLQRTEPSDKDRSQ